MPRGCDVAASEACLARPLSTSSCVAIIFKMLKAASGGVQLLGTLTEPMNLALQVSAPVYMGLSLLPPTGFVYWLSAEALASRAANRVVLFLTMVAATRTA